MRFFGLDGFRGVVALSVVLFHCSNLFHSGLIFPHADTAVDAFFVLSGFVIALNYEKRLKTNMGIFAFFGRRAKRLLPVYWLGTIACIFAAIWTGFHSETSLGLLAIAAMFLIPIMANGILFPLNPQAWSLLYEWIVNLIYAAGGWRLPTRYLSFIWMAAALLFLFLPFKHLPLVIAGFAGLRAITGFAAGVLIFRMKDRLTRHLPVIAPEILYCIWMVLMIIPAGQMTQYYMDFIAIICAPLLILLLIRSEARAPKWCAFAGKLSYPLYASHFAVIVLFRHYMPRPNPWLAGCGVITILALAWGIAILNDHIQAWLPRSKTISASAHPAE